MDGQQASSATDQPAEGPENGPAGPTVLERLLAAGLAEDRAHAHLHAARVQVDGDLVTDPAHPAPPPARIVISGA
ncbi:hypothetical protein BJF78_30790 [Pseudonocardia sp. CNS-139]|nr:hypothetical protein BJF78_30790 [Pseudonocardia sp. CNS-139]